MQSGLLRSYLIEQGHWVGKSLDHEYQFEGAPVLQFVPKQKNLKSDQRRLLDLYTRLDAPNRETLLAFAEFLSLRNAESDTVDEPSSLEPKPLERPERESVVKAIKRLSATYYMLERDQLLDQTSSLMMAHVMQGRDAVSVIDELEIIFNQHYQRYLENR